MLLSSGAEAHSYEPAPMDIAAIQNCDVFICIGNEDEVWVDRILDSIDTSGIKIVRLIDHVNLLEEEPVAVRHPMVTTITTTNMTTNMSMMNRTTPYRLSMLTVISGHRRPMQFFA